MERSEHYRDIRTGQEKLPYLSVGWPLSNSVKQTVHYPQFGSLSLCSLFGFTPHISRCTSIFNRLFHWHYYWVSVLGSVKLNAARLFWIFRRQDRLEKHNSLKWDLVGRQGLQHTLGELYFFQPQLACLPPPSLTRRLLVCQIASASLTAYENFVLTECKRPLSHPCAWIVLKYTNFNETWMNLLPTGSSLQKQYIHENSKIPHLKSKVCYCSCRIVGLRGQYCQQIPQTST